MELRRTRRTWTNCSQVWDTRWWNTQTSQERYHHRKGTFKTAKHFVCGLASRYSHWCLPFCVSCHRKSMTPSLSSLNIRNSDETDSVVLVIMSHGKLGAILGVDWKKDGGERPDDEFPINNIYKHLGPQNCRALLNKPKIIIIQACRGGDS